jgi:AraC-like DNA-binding protein
MTATAREASNRDLPSAYAHELVQLCARWGVGADALLDGLELTLDGLREPSTRVPLAELSRLVQRARALTAEPGLAFYLGMQMRLSCHGFLGFAAMTASSVREALDLAEQFSATRTSAFRLSSYEEGATASLVLEERAPLGDLREFAVVALLLGIGHIADVITGRTLAGVAEMAFEEPPYAQPCLARLGQVLPAGGGTVRFGQPSNRLVFDASILDLPLVSADPVAMQLARAQCERELAALAEAGTFVGRVRTALARGGVGAPPDSGTAFRSLEEVARSLHVSTRTLKRKLAAQGTAFSLLLDEARHQRALLLLDDPDLALADVAARLGYSDTANFARAFKRWTGTPPAAFRQRGRPQMKTL